MSRRTVIVNNQEVFIGNDIVVNSNFLNIRKNVNFEKRGEFVADLCPICMNKISLGDTIQVVINNFKLFPKVLVHKKCVDIQSDKQLSETMEDLTTSYNNFKELSKIWL